MIQILILSNTVFALTNIEFDSSIDKPLLEKVFITKVIDGDTIRYINKDDKEISVRIIGINTPEYSYKSKECFGKEAKDYLKNKIEHTDVYLEFDSQAGDKDKYGRDLRHVFYISENSNLNNLSLSNPELNNSDLTNPHLNLIGLDLINKGFAKEFTYENQEYSNKDIYKLSEIAAKKLKLGLWDLSNCKIKGNINSKEEKIYHLPGCHFYSTTFITESKGERFFNSEKEAINAGWRKTENCN